MAPEQNDFEALCRLLALKRHEQPPPGYFDNFTRQVLARIEAGEGRQVSWLPWYQRLWAALDTRPALAGALGAAACALMIGSVLVFDNTSSQAPSVWEPSAAQAGAGLETSPYKPLPAPSPAMASALAPIPGDSGAVAGLAQQPNPPSGSLFDSVPLPQVTPVSWPVPGGN